ncbi:MAG TPA: TMEM165/GDT1 family protein [Bryobacteraceae bacterium]|jgi:putative Ca2+/H+ antiporter (TMEM165/GDT1 family)|nr:TMEM165/GDT1 family protein [Bryobacteraceae bacterium]
MIAIFFATYGAVFVAEIVGDKLLYTTGVLATRYRTVSVMIGMLIAFMVKMAVAVAVGSAISKLPPLLVATLTGVSFIGVAITLWRKPVERKPEEKDRRAARGVMISFAAIFFSEWGDVGQITAATMAARFGAPMLVWVGAVAAMVTKGALAASIGAGVRQWIVARIPPKAVRYAGVSAMILLGILSILETLTEGHA